MGLSPTHPVRIERFSRGLGAGACCWHVIRRSCGENGLARRRGRGRALRYGNEVGGLVIVRGPG